METLVFFVLYLLAGFGLLAIVWLLSGILVPQIDYDDDWRASL
jgi:hypothetical protein